MEDDAAAARAAVLRLAGEGDWTGLAAALRLPLARNFDGPAPPSAHAQQLLAAAADAECRPPLHVACIRGHIHIVQQILSFFPLLAQQRDVDPRRGGLPVHYAAWGGHLAIVDLLLRHYDASLLDEDHAGNTPHLYAVYGGHIAVVQELLHNRGYRGRTANNSGHTPILQACWGGHLHMVEWLMARGHTLVTRSRSGFTPLLAAASSGNIALVEWLLRQPGVSLKERTNNGDSCLLQAAFSGHAPLVKWLLLEKGANMHDMNREGLNPLLSACNGGRLEVAKMLVEMGADVQVLSTARYTGLVMAASNGHLDVVQWMHAQGVSVHATTNSGDTALTLASYNGHLHVMEWLLDHGGATVEPQSPNAGALALVAAANGDRPQAIEFLVKRGADVNACGADGRRPLFAAAQRGHLACVQLLALLGADLQARTNTYNDALGASLEHHDTSVWLRRHWHFTSLEIAIEMNREDCVRRLLQRGGFEEKNHELGGDGRRC